MAGQLAPPVAAWGPQRWAGTGLLGVIFKFSVITSPPLKNWVLIPPAFGLYFNPPLLLPCRSSDDPTLPFLTKRYIPWNEYLFQSPDEPEEADPQVDTIACYRIALPDITS